MKYSMTIFLLCLLTVGYSQTQIILQQNNVKAYLNTSGHFFNDNLGVSAGYEVPAGSGVNAIYSNAFWFSGTDINGGIRLAAQTYSSGNFQDYYPGPLSTFGGQLGVYGDAEITAAQMAYYDQIWSVSAAEIQNHIQNYNTAGYTPISSIATWPAHGEVNLGQAYYLAPFVDANFDGSYNPMDGDYPKIRGDKAAYMILNDKGGLHFGSVGEPIGLELHVMVYQFSASNHLDQTTFVNIRYINRGTQTLYDFKFSNFLDPDIGNSNDDFMGTNSNLNLVYAYNSSNIDSLYGSAPPAIGVMSLCSPIESSCYFTNTGFAELPNTSSQFYGYMNAQWGNSGLGFTQGGNGYGGTVPTNFIYDDFNTWSELTEGNAPYDKRVLMTLGAGFNGHTLFPGYQGNIDLAFIYARDSTNIGSVEALFNVADSVQGFFDAQENFSCESILLENAEQQNQSFIKLFPNPAVDYFTVDLAGEFVIEIYNLNGQELFKKDKLIGKSQISPNLPAGVYLVKVTQSGQKHFKKLIIN